MSTAEGLADAREVVPTVAQRVVFDDELRLPRRVTAI
jgi:hypothetical protein